MWKNIGYLLGGLVVGAASGYLVAGKKYKELLAIKEQQLEELEKIAEIKEEYKQGSKENTSSDEESPEDSRENGNLSPETRKTLKHLRYKRDEKDNIPYQRYYELEEGEEEIDPAEMESPEEIAKEEHLEHLDDPPELIEADGLGDVPVWVESHSLIYYVQDQLLTEENDEPVANPEYHVGDILKSIDFERYTGEILYIWNHTFDTLYEISLFNSWTEGE